MTNYITVNNDFNDVKRRNFYTFEAISNFIWMCFHFTVVYFFMIRLESLALIGFFLGFGNFISFLVDSPIGVLQKYFSAKKLFKFGGYLILFVSLIFLYFTFSTNTLTFDKIELFSVEALKWLFGSIVNIVLLILSVTFYGTIKELNEVTSNSYVMENSDPSEYSEFFSKKSIFAGIGSALGLLTSGVILAFNAFVAVTILVIITLLYIYFTDRYFDNANEEINLETFKKIKLITKDSIKESLNNYKTELIDNKQDLAEKTKDMKVIFLKPLELKNKINWKEIIDGTKADLKSFILIIFKPPYNLKLLILGGIFVIFGFWDNFVTTFLIDFIDDLLIDNAVELSKYRLQNILTAYVCIGIFCIPAFGAQIPLVMLSSKFGVWKIMIPGLLLSGISMFIFGFASSIYVLLLAGILNGLGYAACLPISQGEFTNEYNVTYAEKNQLKQIETSASSAPLKMLANLANVMGLAGGGLLLQIFSYTGTFIILGLIILGLLFMSLKEGKKLKFW